MKRLSFSIAVALGLLTPGIGVSHVLAQEVEQKPETERGASASDAIEDDGPSTGLPPSGLRAGGFRLFPSLGVTTLYDTNIFGVNGSLPTGVRMHEEEISDTIGVLSPGIAVRSDWSRHELNVNAGADLARYRDNPDEDYNDFWLNADGRYDINAVSNVFGGLGVSRSHEDRTSPEGFQGEEPVRYDSLDAHAGYARRIGQTVVRVGGTAQRLDYDNGVGVDGDPINHDDRDRDIYALGARISYLRTPRIQPFVQVSAEERRYRNTPDDLGYERDSSGYRAAVGVTANLGDRLSGEVYGGALYQEFDDPRFSSVSEPDVGAQLAWQATPYTRVTGSIDRSLEETTYWQFEDGLPAVASSYLYSRAEVLAEHRLTPRTTLSAMVSYGQADYQEVDRADDLVGAGFGVEYKLTDNLLLQLDYRHFQRDSDYRYVANDGNVDLLAGNYQRDQVYLSLKALLYPVHDKLPAMGRFSRLHAERGNGIDGGLYAGAQLGMSGMAAATSGPRGSHGTDDGDMQGTGSTAGAFAGWGRTTRDHWYAGIELEGSRGGGDWSHAKNKSTSRTFSLDTNDSWGASLRGGRVLENGALLYARLGAVRTEFDTFYQANDAPAEAADQTDRQTGRRVGVGVDVPAGDHLFWRLDYSHTDYDAYDVPYGSGPEAVERFDNAEGLFRIGLGWRFGGQPYRPTDPTGGDVSGLYAGAQLGQMMLATDMDAQHRSQGQGPYDFSADFGDTGLDTGIFAGYGLQWDRIYLGVELSADSSSGEWRHERETPGGGGRDFSLEKKGGQALAARLGYQLDNGTLLYARLGKARSQFNYRYAKGAQASNDINRDEIEIGDRYGLGAEVPLTPNTFVRFDYSRTDYGDIEFVTGHGDGANADEVRWENTSDQFRVGVGYRF
ncbi:outer membrane beta-barrel protein [Guyparkeria sp.]|uniref:outer membrane beta-barrel protein n=1 Tax=Guyparkeria sp. TaxID=2035736 RepID=UPI003970F0DF